MPSSRSTLSHRQLFKDEITWQEIVAKPSRQERHILLVPATLGRVPNPFVKQHELEAVISEKALSILAFKTQ